ncbi:MAG: hypothetical protein ACTSQP_05750 [Promethearchaeota archaeon]
MIILCNNYKGMQIINRFANDAKGRKKNLLLKKMLNYLESTGFIIELAVIDREYYKRHFKIFNF